MVLFYGFIFLCLFVLFYLFVIFCVDHFSQDAQLSAAAKEIWIASADTSPTTVYLKQIQMAQVYSIFNLIFLIWEIFVWKIIY